MAEAADFDNWASIIRSCCLTSKTPLAMNEISRDVKLLEGVDVPYRTFGFRSLEEMVRNIPSLRIFNLGGKIVAQTIPSEETAHISKFVRLQKPSKKKSRTMAPRAAPNRYVNTGNRRPSNSKSSYNRSNSFQNNSVPNRPFGHYSSPQQSSYNNRSQQQQNSEHFRRTNSTPATMQTATIRSASSPTTPKVHFGPQTTPSQPPKSTTATGKTEQAPAQQQRLPQLMQQQKQSPTVQTQQIRQPQVNSALSPTSTAQQSSLQQRLATPVLTQLQTSSNIQQRLNVQKPRAAVYPMNDPRLILNSYVEGKNLPLPIYKDVPSKDKNIYSSVTVNSKKYSSYPKEAKTKEDAEKLAAQAALTELLDKSNMPQTTTTNRALIMQRILDIVNAHRNGLFESSLVAIYIGKYSEGLPANWLKLVEHAIRIDIGANNLTILSPQHDNVAASGAQQSRPTSPVNELPALNLSLDEFWFRVYVVYNPTDVWGVVIGEANSDKISDLAIEMKSFYDINAATPTAITPGQHYAVLDSEWHRVRCIKVDDEAKTATVFFIDRGDEDVFPFKNLHDLSIKFCTLPAQAIQISLDGLESFNGCAEMQERLEEALVERDVWVTVDAANKQAAPLSARCYIEEDEKTIKDINLELLRKFMSEVVHPKNFMKTSKAVCEVYVSEIRDKEIYVQVKSTGFKLLNDILTDLANNYLDGKLVKPAGKLEKSKLYLVKTDDKWKRIVVLKELTAKAQVMCVDEGSIIEVEKDCLVAIEGISNTLAEFPPQASRVNLHKISPIMFDKKMAAHLRSLAPKDDVFYMKVVGDREAIPRVELYKRTENNYLASLNDTLALEPEISSKTDDNNNDNKSKSRLRNDRKSVTARTEFPLKKPEIPPIGEFFDVVITMAAHPSNFTVQPLNTTSELKKLMSDLAAACASYNGPPLTSSNVKVGNMYAAKYDNDGKWYRAYVSKILGKNICAVYFCDYGDYRAVSMEQLQPLANHFYDLPYQAIKAKLHGIIPKLKGDWTVKDSLRFNELVVDKSFVSLVKAYDVDNTAAGETILGLELIDTSTDEDVYIIQQLVEEKRAERV